MGIRTIPISHIIHVMTIAIKSDGKYLKFDLIRNKKKEKNRRASTE